MKLAQNININAVQWREKLNNDNNYANHAYHRAVMLIS